MKIRIMIVDDNHLSLDSMYLSLISHGFSVTRFTSSLAALSSFQKGDFDAVLSDYYMPDMKGDELLRRIQIIDPKVKTFLFSGNISKKTFQDKHFDDCSIYLTKPLDIKKIILTLENNSSC